MSQIIKVSILILPSRDSSLVLAEYLTWLMVKGSALTVRVVPAAVLWRQDEGAGGGDGGHVIALAEEGDGGAGGDAEQGGRGVGLSVARREGHAGGVAKGAGRHGDRLAQGVLLGVALGGDGLAGEAPRTQSLLRIVLNWRSTGRHARRACRIAAVHGAGRHRPRWRQGHGNVPDVDGQSHHCLRRLERHLQAQSDFQQVITLGRKELLKG